MNLIEKEKIINNNPIHIATVNENNEPNLSVASDVKVIDENKIIISHNEMINTPINILKNANIVLTTFNKNWQGLRMFGKAKYYNYGEYFDLCVKLFKTKNNNPKGAIIVKVDKVEEIK